MLSNIKTILTDIRLLLILILYTICNIMGYSSTSKYIIVALVLLITFFELPSIIRNKLKWHYSMSLLLAFSLWGLLSYLWALDGDIVIGRFFSLLILDLFYIVSWNIFVYRKDSIDIITTIIILSGIIMSCYVINFYGIINYFNLLSKGIRAGQEITNVNYIGLNAIMSVICCFYKYIKEKKLYYIFLMIIPLLVAFGTGSRKVIISFIFSVFALEIFQKSNNVLVFIKKSFRFVILFGLIFSLLKLPIFSSINERFTSFTNLFSENAATDSSTLARKRLINLGLEIWNENIIGGIGMNGTLSNSFNLGTYLHNNYVELLATVGLVGFMLYYLLYFISLIKLLFYRKYDIDKILILLLIIINLLLDIACVSYYSFQNYVYFILILNYIYKNCEVGEKHEY